MGEDGFVQEQRKLLNVLPFLNAGVVWADQDYKSINHFYNPVKNRGLYGFSNAAAECRGYYNQALRKYDEEDACAAYFYLGAACHLIQDVTIPQHVNIKLLKQHRKYEQWLIGVYESYSEFRACRGGIYLEGIDAFLEYNSNQAMEVHRKLLHEPNEQKKFYQTTMVILLTAQRTTAGFLRLFEQDVD